MLLSNFVVSLLFLRLTIAGNTNYVNYEPAVNIVVANSGPGDDTNNGGGGSTSPGSGQGSSGSSPGSTPSTTPSTSTPFSPATEPICPASHVSCDTIGEPSWCCSNAQHCAFDEGGSVACCPIGNFCHGTGKSSNVPQRCLTVFVLPDMACNSRRSQGWRILTPNSPVVNYGSSGGSSGSGGGGGAGGNAGSNGRGSAAAPDTQSGGGISVQNGNPSGGVQFIAGQGVIHRRVAKSLVAISGIMVMLVWAGLL